MRRTTNTTPPPFLDLSVPQNNNFITEMQIDHIDTSLLTRGRLEVIILKAESPLLFWVRTKNGETHLLEMEEELQLRMLRKANSLHLYPEHMEEGMDVAVKDHQMWRRGFIKTINRDNGTVQVVIGDWGRTVWRRMFDVYRLEERFKELSWRALICGLAHTTAPDRAARWSRKTQDLCRLLLEGQTGWINIVHPLRKGTALVKLHIDNHNNMFDRAYNFRDALIRIGHAELCTKVTADVEPAV